MKLKQYFIACLICLAMQMQAENLIDNPSAEIKDPQTGLAKNWQTLQLELKGEFHSVANIAQDGEASLRISCDDSQLTVNNYLLWIQRGLEKKLRDCPPGTEMELTIYSNTLGNPNVKYRFYVEMMKGEKYCRSAISAPLTNYIGWQKKTIYFNMPDEIPTSAYVCLQLLTPGIVCFDNISLRKKQQEVVEMEKPLSAKTDAEYGLCRVTDFPPRKTWYLPEKPKSLKMQFILPPEAENKLRVTLKNEAGQTLKSEDFKDQNEALYQLPDLPPGGYIISYEAGAYADEEYFRVAKAEDKHQDIYFDQLQRMYVKGKAFFPIMIAFGAAKMEEESLRIYREAGFNTIGFPFLVNDLEVGRKVGKILEEMDFKAVSLSYGLGRMRANTDADSFARIVRKYKETCREIPGMIGVLDDEAEMLEASPLYAKLAYKEVFFAMPEIVTWQNHAPRMTGKSGQKYGNFDNVKRFTAAADVTGCDIYPVPEGNFHNELDNKTLSCVGDFTDLSLQSGYMQKPVWMILQAGSWPEWYKKEASPEQPRPDYLQTRFMIYNAITHGARGIVMAGPGTFTDVYSSEFPKMADIFKELNYVSSWITEGKPVPVDNKALPSHVKMEVWEKPSRELMAMLVNESKQETTLSLPLTDLTSTWFELPHGNVWQEQETKLAPYAVLLLTSKAKKLPQTSAYQATQNKKQKFFSPTWKAQWTCHPSITQSGKKVFARHNFNLTQIPKEASLYVTADHCYTMYVNGKQVGQGALHVYAFVYDLQPYLKKGDNLLEFTLTNSSFPGLVYQGKIGEKYLVSGENTSFSSDGVNDWQPGTLKGHPPSPPWGNVIVVR